MAKKLRGAKSPIQNQSEKYDSYVEVIELSSDDLTVTNQRELESTPRGYIEFGINDNQFQYLENLFNGSPTHGAIVNSLTRMVYGNGLNVEGVIEPKEDKKVIKDFNIFGNAVLQVTATDIYHLSVPTVRAFDVDSETGSIEWYAVSSDFSNNNEEIVTYPRWTPKWKPTKKFPSAIYYIKNYSPSAFYYGLPDFQAGLSYMEQEIEIAKFLIDYVKNNFSVTTIISFNNGVSDPESRTKMKNAVKDKFSGSKGDKIIVAFTKGKEYETTVQNVEISNASEQYEYMTRNARSNIIVSHNIVTPTLVGVRDNSVGFSSTSDEMVKGRILLEEMKIEGVQQTIDDAYREIKSNESIKHISSVTVEDEIPDEKVELKKVNPELNAFVGLGVDGIKGYTLCHEGDLVDYDFDGDIHKIVKELNGEKLELASSGTNSPMRESEQDSDGYIVRYRYKGDTSPQRQFCRVMMRANKLYRKEDIIAMENKAVNPGFGLNGTNTYSIWLWKGGGLMSARFPNGTCQHLWRREVYAVTQTDSGNVDRIIKRISVAQAKRDGVKIESNNIRVGITPHAMKI